MLKLKVTNRYEQIYVNIPYRKNQINYSHPLRIYAISRSAGDYTSAKEPIFRTFNRVWYTQTILKPLFSYWYMSWKKRTNDIYFNVIKGRLDTYSNSVWHFSEHHGYLKPLYNLSIRTNAGKVARFCNKSFLLRYLCSYVNAKAKLGKVLMFLLCKSFVRKVPTHFQYLEKTAACSW